MDITVGATVTVRLYTGKTIEGMVKAIVDKVEGRRFRVVSGKTSLLVNPNQISNVTYPE